MFVVTLSKASVKKLGVGAMCCALVVFSAMLGRYISTRSVAVAAAGNKIESAQDIQTWFTGYGLDVDGASITADKVKIPRRWDDSFSAFNGVVQQSGMDLARYKGKTVEKWSALLPAASNGETSRYGVLLVYKKKAVGAYLLEKPSGTVLGLQDAQNELANAVFESGKPVVTVLISGRPHAIPEIAEKSDAVLWSFYPGPWGGTAIAEVLSGAADPCGCLPVSVPRTTGQLPVYYNARASYDVMRYRDLENTPLYPFGFGLHYTTFKTTVKDGTPEISIAALENGKAHTVTCEVENTGSTAGHATVQLYIQGVSGTIVRRVRELKAFEKVYLQPGEKKTVELKLDCDALSIWNRKMQFAPEESKVELYVEESGSKVWNGELKITK